MKYKNATIILCNGKKINDRIFAFLVLTIGSLNIFLMSDDIVMYVLIALETMILFGLFLKGDKCGYFIYLMAFISIGLDLEAVFKGKQQYGLITFEIFGISYAAILIFLSFVMVFPDIKRTFSILKKNKVLFRIFLGLTMSYLFAIVIGIFMYIINDNNIQSLDGGIRSYLGWIYFYGMTLIIIFIVISLGVGNRNNVERMKEAMESILICLCIILAFSHFFGPVAKYDVYDYIICSTCTIYIPGLVIVSIFKKRWDEKIGEFIFALFFAMLGLVWGASGKGIILLLCIPLIVLLKMPMKQKILFGGIFVGVTVGAFLALSKIPDMFPETILAEKVKQVMGLLDIGATDYFEQMPLSPRTRIVELIDIYMEYQQKPYFALLGKGFLGSFKDYSNQLIRIDSAFTDAEWKAGLFYAPHESFSRFWLINGAFGVAVFIMICFRLIKGLYKSPWALIGLIWFVFFYGYSFPITIFGGTAFIIGILEMSEKDEIKT